MREQSNKERAKISNGTSDDVLYGVCEEIVKSYITEDNMRLIDVGCGQGSFLKRLRNVLPSTNLLGIDVYDHAGLSRDHDLHVTDLNNPDFSEVAPADFVISIEVIEHLENPRAFLRSLVGLVKPGCTVMVTTPNVENIFSVCSLFLNGYFRGFGPRNYPAHITPISEMSFKWIVEELDDLELISVGYTNRLRIPSTWYDLQKFLPFLKGKRWSDNFYIIAV